MVLSVTRSMIRGSLAFVACLLLSLPGAVVARPVVRSIRSAHGTYSKVVECKCYGIYHNALHVKLDGPLIHLFMSYPPIEFRLL